MLTMMHFFDILEIRVQIKGAHIFDLHIYATVLSLY